jgi:hypothetical protein
LNTQFSLSKNIKPISRSEIPGAGQISVAGQYAYVGHILNKSRLGTSILDISDPRSPRVVSQIFQDDAESQTHKARVVGDLLFVNSERTPVGRRADDFPVVREKLKESLGRNPTHEELAEVLVMRAADIPMIEKASARPYVDGGFRIYDISNRAKPRLLTHQKTGKAGVHRFDVDENYAYMSTEMDGYLGNILVIYDIRNPEKPEEVSRWWIPGQHIAGGETPTWVGRRHRLHHALRFGDELWAGIWQAGVSVIDVKDIKRPKTIGTYNFHPPFPLPTHTFMPLDTRINGRRIAVSIDEEDHAHDQNALEERRGRPHAGLQVFDVTDTSNIKPLGVFEVSEMDSPWSRTTPGRFGAHQFHEKPRGTLIFCSWFSGGLRVVDVAKPSSPREVAYHIPQPAEGRPAPLSNDVFVSENGLIYLADRNQGLDILELDC